MSEDGYDIVHHRSEPPYFFISPRSLIVTYYPIETSEDEYTFMMSSRCNQYLLDGKYKEAMGDDTIAWSELTYYNFK